MANREISLVLGTAGHIDHGKTTLVKAITGVDCDRLSEEKKRGITIELGFAPLTMEDGRVVSIVDVPGHERFIRQMVAGASGIDAVMLVVAADEGIMPQTREHLEILKLLGVKDSKQMTAFEREQLAPVIKSVTLDFAVAWVDSEEIDSLGMAKAGRLVFQRAIRGLKQLPTHLLIDYFKLPEVKIPQTCLVKGDQRSLSIACASVLAKQARDQFMLEISDGYPGYLFAQNKGYGSPEHLKAIEELGLCQLHRHSFCDHLLQGRLFD